MSKKTIARVLISAPQRSSGKTTVSIGLARAFSKKGLHIQTFKKGPDYIDPMWLKSASGNDCYNLDYLMMGENKMLSSFKTRTHQADLAIIEGNMGLYDDIDINGFGSSANLSKLLKAPVILVINTKGMNRGIVPLVKGYLDFEPDVNIVGIILNRVGGDRHNAKLRDALNHYCNIEILGSIPADEKLEIAERHLGLTPAVENQELNNYLDHAEQVMNKYVNLNRIHQLAQLAPALPTTNADNQRAVHYTTRNPKINIGVAQDQVFSFYYPENLEALEHEGANLITFNTLKDHKLPNVTALYIGGGFPELFMDELEANDKLRQQILTVVESGMPVYAECGGLMYLARSISMNGIRKQMVGAIPCDILFSAKPKGLGYMKLQQINKNSWLKLDGEMIAHEFHHSEAQKLDTLQFAYKVNRGTGITGKYDGIIYKNILASYAHLHAISTPEWASQFIRISNKIGFTLY